MADISSMDFKGIRVLAKQLGVNPSGKDRNELIRLVEKAQKAKAGKGTPADPSGGKKPVVKRNETGVAAAAPKEREEEEEEEEAPPVAATPTATRVAKAAAIPRDEALYTAFAATDQKVADMSESVEAHDNVIITLAKFAAALAAEIGMEVPEEIQPLLAVDEEEEAPAPAKKAKTKPAKDDDEIEDDEEDAEDEDDEAEDEETLDISAAELEEAAIERLTEIATAINESGKGAIKIVKSARILRDSIRDFLNKHAEVIATEEPKSKKTGAVPQVRTLDVPEGFRLGAKVDVNFGEDGGWQPGTIQTIDDVEGKCDVTLDDGEECEAEWSEMRVKPAEQRKRVVKKS